MENNHSPIATVMHSICLQSPAMWSLQNCCGGRRGDAFCHTPTSSTNLHWLASNLCCTCSNSLTPMTRDYSNTSAATPMSESVDLWNFLLSFFCQLYKLCTCIMSTKDRASQELCYSDIDIRDLTYLDLEPIYFLVFLFDVKKGN